MDKEYKESIELLKIAKSKKSNDVHEAFGWELLVNLYGCNPETIRSKTSLIKFVKELIDLLDMKSYKEPIIHRFGFNKKETIGYSIIQLIETSSISLHCSESKNSAYFEIFSCKEFNAEKAAEFCKNYFEADKIEKLKVDRK